MEKFGRLIYKNRKLVLALWAVFVIAFVFFALKLPSVLGGSGFEYDGTYDEVEKILDKDFGIPESSIILLFERSGNAKKDAFKRYIEETIDHVDRLEGTDIYRSPLESPDMMKESRAYALIELHGDKDKIGSKIENIRKELKKEGNFSAGLTGRQVIEEDMSKAAQDDLVRAELIGIPIAIIVLLLAFRGVIAAVIPLLTGFVSVIFALGLLYFTGQKMELSIFVLNTAPMIGLALGIDFALLSVNRFREELGKKPVEQAVITTVATSGKTIIFSGFCVLLGMIGMLFINVGVFQAVALAGIAVVFTSVLAANTFLPAVLGILGHRINKWMILRSKEKEVSGWHRFASFVMKRPVIMAFLAAGILFTGALPVGKMNLSIPEADALPKSFDSRTAHEKFEETFSSDDTVTVPIIARTTDDITEKNSLEELEKVTKEIESDPLVTKTESIFSTTNLNPEEIYASLSVPDTANAIKPAIDQLTNDNQALIQVTLDAAASSDKAKTWVREWNEKDMTVPLLVGGHPKFQQEIFDEIYDKIIYSLAFILLSTYIVLFWAFRSVLIPLKAILMNIISLSCTFGIVVWLFQGGHLGFHLSDIALMIPVFAFSIVFGLSMDYEVFLISRIHEVYLKTGDNDRATLEGLISTSKIITSAAAIMIVITGAFAFTGVVPVQQMGVTVAIAIFIDATIVRMMLVPSLMKLLGDLNWWVPFKKRNA
ncbi:membrane protein [Siminovitchia terrae]|uniref:MMPL family transporter n=1 Tax=Siminovitchia terrae TaxID=1914933 RepID=A0A429X6B8_SIMTE|nr:MMPL family transporter [Siminovitchia terrae]RST58801.1 MMPL family transporter [Siminovitchia terrae]GIN89339.1 membrane protein [Siminovitchia terrae]